MNAKREPSPEILKTTHRVFEGDARVMSELPDRDAVHLVVTSPPYWNLKEYPEGPGSQLGNLGDYEKFLKELRRGIDGMFGEPGRA